MAATVEALGIASGEGAPIEPQQRIRVAIAHGVVGDRYAADNGHFKGFPDQEVTLVEAEDAESVGLAPLALRRNIVTRGIAHADLIGRSFAIGEAILHGMRPCLPCGYLEGSLSRPGLKSALRGGLRARVVRAGEVRVGDAIRIVEPRLDDDMRAVIHSAHLAFVATVTPEGRPNLSPKGTIRALDDRHLFFLDLASPQTRKDIEKNAWMEINLVEPLSRRGYRFLGQARAHVGDDVHRAAEERIAREEGTRYENKGAVVLTIERVLPLLSPGYLVTHDERDMRASHRERRASLDAEFDAHLAKHGHYRAP